MVMSWSASEILQSSPSSGEDKKVEERQGPSGLFAMLLQQSSMQQVAYAGLINEFNLALTLHGQAAGSHMDSAPPPEQPLASTQEAAVPPDDRHDDPVQHAQRSEEHTSELQSLMRNSYAVFCLKKKKE